MNNTLFIIDGLPGIRSYAVWLVVTYGGVAISMVADFVTGVRKARRNGIATRSRGYKRTCDKAVKYFLPMLCLTCIDLISIGFFSAPFLTMGMGAFNIFCEWVSVMETAYEKRQIRDAAETVRTVISNRDDIAKAVVDIIERLMDDNEKEVGDERD